MALPEGEGGLLKPRPRGAVIESSPSTHNAMFRRGRAVPGGAPGKPGVAGELKAKMTREAVAIVCWLRLRSGLGRCSVGYGQVG